MKLVKPIAIDSDSVLVSSNIAEPDLSTGEVEWINPLSTSVFASDDRVRYSSCADKDGNIYAFGSGSSVLKLSSLDGSLSSFGLISGRVYSSSLSSNGKIYCVGNSGAVHIVDPSDDSISSFGSYSDEYLSSISAGDNIFCIGSGDEIMIIDTTLDSISFLTKASLGEHYSMSMTNSGYIYCVGTVSIEVINSVEIATSSFGSISGRYLSSATLANDNIYCVGSSGGAIIIDTANKTISSPIAIYGSYSSSVSVNDGSVYFSGPSGNIMKVADNGGSVSFFSSGTAPNSMSVGFGGDIFGFGAQANVIFIKMPYKSGDISIKTSTHKIYQAVTTNSDDPEIGVSLAVPSWIEVSATNKYKPFDDVVGTQVESDTGTITYEILPGDIVGGIAGLNLENATSVNVVMNDPTYGEVYNNTLALLDESNVVDAYSYWWSDFKYKTVFTMLDLPSFKNATITVIITGSGTVKAGVIIVGPSFDLGTTLHGTNTKLLDYSTYNEDSFGNITVTKRVPAKLVNFMVSVQSKDDLDDVYEILESMVGEYGLYIGEEENAKEMTTAFGLHRNITLSKDEPTLNKYTLQIRGLT